MTYWSDRRSIIMNICVSYLGVMWSRIYNRWPVHSLSILVRNSLLVDTIFAWSSVPLRVGSSTASSHSVRRGSPLDSA